MRKRGFGKKSNVPSEPQAKTAVRNDADLPIASQRAAIEAALRSNQVFIVAGDTGSGKSTQLPQYCLESGRGLGALIAHTQPRRLAARALAARIAEEMGQPVGRSVGFRVRFADQVSDATRLLLVTDGLLLAELAADPMLRHIEWPGLSPEEKHEGFILPCVAYAQSDLVIELPF